MLKPTFKYINKAITISCPICGFSEGDLLYSITASDATQHFVLKEVEPVRHNKLQSHISKLWGQSTCDSVSCRTCGFGYAEPYVAGDSTFYTLAYERSGYPIWGWEYEVTKIAIKETILGLGQSSLRLLEIGSGNGAFVRKIAPEILPKENVFCLEFSDYGRQIILDYGIECDGVDIRSLNNPKLERSFDIICMFQVLEHMDRLEQLFKKINHLATSQAHIFIAVPNPKRIQFNETHGNLLDMPPNHIGRWNQSSFELVGSKFGWKLVEHKIEPQNIYETIKQQITYRYLRMSQNSTSLANVIERIKYKQIRHILRMSLAICYSFTRFNVLYYAVHNEDLGDSQWVHLVRESTSY